MKNLFFSAALLLCLTAAGLTQAQTSIPGGSSPLPPKVVTDQERIQGVWKVTFVSRSGHIGTVSIKRAQASSGWKPALDYFIRFDKDAFQIFVEGKPVAKGTFNLNPAPPYQKPIDLVFSARPEDSAVGGTQLGIYRLYTNDKFWLTVGTGKDLNVRPFSFASNKTAAMTLVLVRVKG